MSVKRELIDAGVLTQEDADKAPDNDLQFIAKLVISILSRLLRLEKQAGVEPPKSPLGTPVDWLERDG